MEFGTDSEMDRSGARKRRERGKKVMESTRMRMEGGGEAVKRRGQQRRGRREK